MFLTAGIRPLNISKRVAEKNSICYIYGRSKKIVQQRREQIQRQLQEINRTIQLFEKEVIFKVEQHIDCSLAMKRLLSNINAFVHEYQKKSRDELQYKKQILILDAIDHHLVHTFFTFKPNKSQVRLSTILFFCFSTCYFLQNSL